MYAGTIIEYDDQSQIRALPIADVRSRPMYLSLITSDKGPEEWTCLTGKDWFKAYGDNISFARHGQPLLQAAISINAGAKLLTKRLVAADATLANLSIVANLTEEEYQATDKDGNLIYLDTNGDDTDEVTDTPKMLKRAKIKYEGMSVEAISANDPELIYNKVEGSLTEDQYLLFTICDNGRGTSNKRFMIVPNYRLSKAKTYVEYDLTIQENGVYKESMSFTAIPDLVVNGKNHSIESVVKTSSTQIRAIESDEGMTNFIAKLSEITGRTVDEIHGMDFLFGNTKKNVGVPDMVIDTEGLNLQSGFGQALLEGTNGAFGNCPIAPENEELYVKQAEYALGTDSSNVYDTAIYDLDRYKIDLIIDANYPAGVKRAIETLVTFREDCCFMRDMGLGLTSLEMVDYYNEELLVRNKFIATYCTSYDVIDPYSKKQISVTIGYSLAKLMVNHLNAGRILPVCGIKHDMIIPDAIKGTLNFAPVVCPEPKGNQKEYMEDIRVNYATYIGEDLVVETEYTSQEDYTQFSYLNNVLGIQEVARAIRTRCPAIRYSFIEGEDLDRYKNDIETVIANYTDNFNTLTFDYIADPVYTNNKIFYAALNVAFKEFVQTEWFKITAINAVES